MNPSCKIPCNMNSCSNNILQILLKWQLPAPKCWSCLPVASLCYKHIWFAVAMCLRNANSKTITTRLLEGCRFRWVNIMMHHALCATSATHLFHPLIWFVDCGLSLAWHMLLSLARIWRTWVMWNLINNSKSLFGCALQHLGFCQAPRRGVG